MTGQKAWIRGTILVFLASPLFILSGCAPVRTTGFSAAPPVRFEIPTRVQGGDLSPPEPVVLTDEQGKYLLGLHMEILEDPGGELTIEQVSSPAFDGRFTPSQMAVPNFGFTNSAFWLRLHLVNETSQINQWLLEATFQNLNYVDLYLPSEEAGFVKKESGALLPFNTREIPYHHLVFKLPLEDQTEKTVYLRIQTGSGTTFGFILWSPEAFTVNKMAEMLGFGLFYGFLLMAFGYHLFLLFSLREANYFYFALFLASSILWFATYEGLSEQYLWPGLALNKRISLVVTQSLFFLASLKFSAIFLELKTRAPRLHRLYYPFYGFWALMIAIVPFSSFGTMGRLVTWGFLFTPTLVAVSGFLIWRRGFLSARFYLFSWLGFLCGVLSIVLARNGLIASTIITEKAYQTGLIWLVLWSSLALVDRINELKANTEKANQQLLNSQRELSQILDGVPLGIVVYGKDQMPRYVNEWASEILSNPARGIQPGLRPRRTLAQAINHYSLHVAGTNVKYPLDKFPIYRALKGQPSSIDDLEADLVDRRIPIEMWASPVKDKVGNIEAAVAAFQDITQRKQAEAELEAYRKRLEIMVEERTRELQLHVDWLSAINQINQTVARSADFTQIYSKIIEIINLLFAAHDSFIAELDQNGGQLRILSHSCQKDNHAALIGSLITLPDGILDPSNRQPGGFVIMTRAQVISMDGPFGEHIRISDNQGIVGSPLQVREQIIGFLGLEMRDAGRTLTPQESNLLNIFSTDIAQILENARLIEQAKMSVAKDERDRLARELHDSVAQALYAVSLYADAIRLALQANKPQAITDNLEELIQSARDAMADMRLLIFQLRPPVLNEEGLLAALQNRLESVEGRAGFKTQLLSEGEVDLSADQETELYWIAQEILNNVVKHAHAKQVKVHVMGEADCIRLVVEDDGVGFDPVVGSRAGGHGIRNIHERAEKIGASCWIESAPSQGTRVTIEVNR
jgi:signal transduction histidine kinase